MPASRIIVRFRDGSPGRDERVALPLAVGPTKPVFADKDGRCVVEHVPVGTVTIYVDGDNYRTVLR